MMGMVPEEYERMAALEETMWWYQGLHSNVRNALRRHAPSVHDLLDAGCGTGGTLKMIGEAFPQARLHGIDLSAQACAHTRRKTGASVEVGSVEDLPYPQDSFDALVSCDVLGYPIDVDRTVAGFHRVLRPGGIGVINLAAYGWMLSYHDRAVGQVRRFSRAEGVALMRRHGLQPLFASYWNTLLFPLMVLKRKLLPAPAASDVAPVTPVVNTLFKGCVAIESALMDRGVRLPFGGSVLIIAQKART